ncbi:hypothetical protein [Streptomyces yunnanensis]|uniref:Uncharacterized protein n=1 Tax=Streptomyces yunnanensis TaxID=156453 RepID=A0A9X8QVH3_9ACTN|nr:hypothetical protein [Streptomyces yunnanensis]SHM44207.1 hypothetical protein SAMN05216268_11127 [Streptomyces yunnanensis]
MNIDKILNRALLVRERTLHRDIVPIRTITTDPDARPINTPAYDAAAEELRRLHAEAAEDLRALCETLVAYAPATIVANFLTDQLPEPRSALILACVLQLTDFDDGARFWWQYAAGAGYAAAAYCLYLHHLAHGERETAQWWHRQTDSVQQPLREATTHRPPTAPEWSPSSQQVANTPTTTILRILRLLAKSTPRQRTAAVTGLMDYLPHAVAAGYLCQPEVEIPLPGPDFARRIRSLLAAAINRSGNSDTPSPRPDILDTLPSRPAPHTYATDPEQPLDRLSPKHCKGVRPSMGETATR